MIFHPSNLVQFDIEFLIFIAAGDTQSFPIIRGLTVIMYICTWKSQAQDQCFCIEFLKYQQSSYLL